MFNNIIDEIENYIYKNRNGNYSVAQSNRDIKMISSSEMLHANSLSDFLKKLRKKYSLK